MRRPRALLLRTREVRHPQPSASSLLRSRFGGHRSDRCWYNRGGGRGRLAEIVDKGRGLAGADVENLLGRRFSPVPPTTAECLEQRCGVRQAGGAGLPPLEDRPPVGLVVGGGKL